MILLIIFFGLVFVADLNQVKKDKEKLNNKENL